MPQHRRLTRPGSIHARGYWQDTDPTLEGPVAEGTSWFNTTDPDDIIEMLYEGDEWVVAPGAGTIKMMVLPIGNGTLGLTTGIQFGFQLPGAGEFLAWRVIDPFEATPSIQFDIWVEDDGTMPVLADSIISSGAPALVADNDSGYTDVNPANWIEAWIAGSLCIIYITSVSGCTGATLQLFYRRTP